MKGTQAYKNCSNPFKNSTETTLSLEITYDKGKTDKQTIQIMTKPNISKQTLDNDKAQHTRELNISKRTVDNDKAQHIKMDIR